MDLLTQGKVDGGHGDTPLTERISTLRALLDEHYEPGVKPSKQLQRVIDELDRLVAMVMHERLEARACSSGRP